MLVEKNPNPLARVAAAFSNRRLVAVLEDNVAKRFLINELVRRTFRPAILIKAALELAKYVLKFVDARGLAETETGLLQKLSASVKPDGLVGRALLDVAELIESAELQSKLEEILQRDGRVEDIPTRALTASAHSPELKVALRVLMQVDKLGSISEALAKLTSPQPLLGLRMERNDRAKGFEDIDDLIFTNRLTSFIGRDEDVQFIAEFLEDERPVLWQVLTGRAGTGKSRLAMEFCLGLHDGEHGCWEAGFYIPRSLQGFDWGRWSPDSHKLIILDNAAEQVSDIRDLLEQLHSDTKIGTKIRFLLLERSAAGPWWDILRPPLEDHTGLVREIQWDEPYELSGLSEDEGWLILKQTFERAGGSSGWLRQCQSRVRRVTNKMGAYNAPLYAMIVGMHFAAVSKADTASDVKRTSIADLIGELVDKERRRWRNAGVPQPFETMIATATMVGGLRPGDGLARDLDFDLYQRAIPSEDDVAEPLTPDLIGEFFVLEHVTRLPADVAEALIRQCWLVSPSHLRIFAERCLQDFPRHVGLTLLLSNPGDLHDAKFLRSETALHWFKLAFDAADQNRDQDAFLGMLAAMFRAMRIGFKPDEKLTARVIGRAPDNYGARRLFSAFEEAGYELSTFHYNNLLKHAPAGRVQSIVEMMQQRSIPFSEVTFVLLLGKDKGATLDATLGDMEARGISPTNRLFGRALRSSEPMSMPVVFARMFEYGVVPTNNMIELVARKAEPAAAFQMFQDAEARHKHVLQQSYFKLAKRSEYTLARRIIQHLRSKGRRLGHDFYASAIDAAPDTASADELLQWMKEDGRSPDQVIYTVLMNRGSYDQALALLSEMESRSIAPDEYVFAILVRKAPTVEIAKVWHAKAISAGAELTPTYLSTILQRLPTNEAVNLLNNVQNDQLRLDSRVYQTIFAKRDLTYEGKISLYESMKARGLEPSEAIVSLLLRVAPSFSDARKLLDDLVEFGVARTPAVYATMVGRTETSQQLAELEPEIEEAGFEKSEQILEALAWKAQPERAVDLLKEMRARGFRPAEKLFGSIMNICDPTVASKLLEDAGDYGVTPNLEMFNILLTKLGRGGLPGRTELLARMKTAGIGWDKYTVMGRLLNAEPDEVEGVVAEAISQCVLLDAPMIRLAVDRTRDFASGRRLVDLGKGSGVTPNADIFAGLASKGTAEQIAGIFDEMKLLSLPRDARVESAYLKVCPHEIGLAYVEGREREGAKFEFRPLLQLFKTGTHVQRLRVAEKIKIHGFSITPSLSNLLAQSAEDFADGFRYMSDALGAGGEVYHWTMVCVTKQAEDGRQIGKLLRLLHHHGCSVDERTGDYLSKAVARLTKGRNRTELRHLIDDMRED